ncbi:Putative JmjC domain-containing protein [Septoria linicola]|uniref:JmjC domain-containing protein n=1 Tax=Septoria linicola TaxID=215465 RepID=A0A9Q9EJ33_9PEZI|nr:Putative JmjC domain-containing protein [Septoria linicola]
MAGAAVDVEPTRLSKCMQDPVQLPGATTNGDTMAQTAVKFDPRMYGRERSTRKRTITPPQTELVPLEPSPSAKRRKLNHELGKSQSAATPRVASSAPTQLATPPQESEAEMMIFIPPPVASHVDGRGNVRPLRDEIGDRRYVEAMMQELQGVIAQKRVTVHRRSAARIADLLSLADYPDEEEAKFVSRDEALAELAPGKFFNGPIITAEQQPLPLSTTSQFLEEYYDDNATVHIQDSSSSIGKTGTWARSVSMRQVKERFQQTRAADHCPWNMLELATHHDDGLRPSFLNNEDCRLITKLKIPDYADETRRRKYEPGWKEVEKWALLAEAGALTEPHQDSHGYSTFITFNQGCVGFGWLSNPSKQERDAWKRNPQIFRGGKWRYVVLKPGQTVFFPAGTVHMVFRLRAAGDSLAFGGHILRCSNIVHWINTILDEHENQNIVNEDLGESAAGYLERVDRFVDQARRQGQEDKWGGQQSINEFKRLLAKFRRLPKPKSLSSKKTSKA